MKYLIIGLLFLIIQESNCNSGEDDYYKSAEDVCEEERIEIQKFEDENASLMFDKEELQKRVEELESENATLEMEKEELEQHLFDCENSY